MINYEQLANDLIDSHIDLYGVSETIERLVSYGLTNEDLEELLFDRKDIESANAQGETK